jgi:Rrf2 family protein
MRVTTWAEYGLIVSIHLARHAGKGPVAARELSEQERLPHDYVEQILLRLRRAGLVDSVRGARGGYLLAREPQSVSVTSAFPTVVGVKPVTPSPPCAAVRPSSC